ncbi:MAG TPA: HAD-IA family hydrolase [Candidatus Dormibacteraeota bacterium]|nr:HAD-IA family hydrolase [Candidatus Dormibacteraeota bacterium]
MRRALAPLPPDTTAASAPPAALRALIFDVDGTLADTEEGHRQAFNAAFRTHGLTWSWSPAEYAELLQVTGGKERIRAYIERLAAADPARRHLVAVAAIHATKSAAYVDLLARGGLRLRAGVQRLMHEARSAGVRLAIASTTSPANVEALLAKNFPGGARGGFDVIATGDVVRYKKPAPDIYRLALAQLGVRADEAMAFEDSMIGVQAAKAAGLVTVAVPSSWTAGQDLAAADLVLSSLGDPEQPLPESDAWRVGANFLGLEELRTLHRAAAGAAAAP